MAQARLQGIFTPNLIPYTADGGINEPELRRYADWLIERGVRFVELTMMKGIRFVAPWDDHGDILTNHPKHAIETDQPVAALLIDLAKIFVGVLLAQLPHGVANFLVLVGCRKGRDIHGVVVIG